MLNPVEEHIYMIASAHAHAQVEQLAKYTWVDEACNCLKASYLRIEEGRHLDKRWIHPNPAVTESKKLG